MQQHKAKDKIQLKIRFIFYPFSADKTLVCKAYMPTGQIIRPQ